MTKPKALGPDIRYLYTYQELPIGATAIGLPEGRKTGLWRYTRPLFQEKTPPCQEACPAGNWIRKFVSETGAGNLKEAWRDLRLENPFPGVCGRVCCYPCESSCNRKDFDDATSIHGIERFLADHFFQEEPTLPVCNEKQGKSAAVVGSGPAGLACAYFLHILGYHVTLFEALDRPGGIPRIGIPAYRLPRGVLDKEIHDILSLGIELRSGTRVGKNVSFSELLSYDGVFLATGAHRPATLNIPIDGKENVYQGLDFLAGLNAGKLPDLGMDILVIGGGNVAMDVCRTLIRMGRSAKIVYRRTREELPAHSEEVDEATQETVRFEYLLSPLSIERSNNGGVRLRCASMRLEGLDSTGRPKPVPIEGQTVVIEADQIILATGEMPDLSYLPEGIERTHGLLEINEVGQTSIEKVFAGGDMTDHPWTVSHAVGSAKRAAIAMDHFLKGDDIQKMMAQGSLAHTMRVHLGLEKRSGEQEIATLQDLNLDYYASRPAKKTEKLPVSERIHCFQEVNCGLSLPAAMDEADRCMSCGVCKLCGNCYLYCPDGAVQMDPSSGRFAIDYDYCKGCGICQKECPVAAITVRTEGEG